MEIAKRRLAAAFRTRAITTVITHDKDIAFSAVRRRRSAGDNASDNHEDGGFALRSKIGLRLESPKRFRFFFVCSTRSS